MLAFLQILSYYFCFLFSLPTVLLPIEKIQVHRVLVSMYGDHSLKGIHAKTSLLKSRLTCPFLGAWPCCHRLHSPEVDAENRVKCVKLSLSIDTYERKEEEECLGREKCWIMVQAEKISADSMGCFRAITAYQKRPAVALNDHILRLPLCTVDVQCHVRESVILAVGGRSWSSSWLQTLCWKLSLQLGSWSFLEGGSG